MKTIAIICSCDTKPREAAFMKELIEKEGLKALVIDVATGPNPSSNFDIPRTEVIKALGVTWEEMEPKTKGEKIGSMQQAVALFVKKLYEEGTIQGVLAAGGLQNTVMATTAMKGLPIGVPKVMATTVASGGRPFDLVVGDKDIVVIPSICDFTGLNMVTKKIMEKACACCAGMVKSAGEVLKKEDKPVIGVTLMGVTNTGCCSAIEELERNGFEVIGFHSTGVGGMIMEQMAEDGLIDGVLDMTTHELTSVYFAGGFSYGKEAENRLTKTLAAKVPIVVCPGGLDFVDFNTNEMPDRMDERVYILHNANTAHIKILPDEAVGVAGMLASKLEKAVSPVKVIIPTDGMRHDTREGEGLYYKKVDQVITEELLKIKNSNVEVELLEGNLDTKEWGIAVAQQMMKAYYSLRK